MKGHYNEPLGVYSPHALYMYIVSAASYFYAKFRQHCQNNSHICTGNNRIKNNYNRIPESIVLNTVNINTKTGSSAGTRQFGAALP
jgi:hypothetical protein